MSCPEPPMGISGVGSFPVWSGGSLFFPQLFRCRNLALNRMFILKNLRGQHGGVSYLGDTCMPHMFPCPPYIGSPCTYVPHALLCICMFYGVSACDMGMGASIWLYNWMPPMCLESPICLVLTPYFCIPPCSPVHLYVLGSICMWYRGYTPHVGVWGASACLSGILVSVCISIVLSLWAAAY